MKKIYMILAAMTLLSMSLNAQQLTTIDRSQLKTAYTNPTTSFYNTLKSIKGMSGILPEVNPNWSSSKGQSRAPLKINSDETTVGPFTGNYFDPNAGMGFGNAYNQAQMVLIEVDLDRSDYANFIGEEIVGFRLALAGDATKTVQVGQFIAWPFDSNGSFEQDNRHTWSIGELTTPAGNPYYEKVTSTSGLESGAEYLIVYENDNVAFNGGLTTLDVGNNVISVNRNGTIIESNATTDAATFTITANGNYYTIRSKSGYYIGRTSSSNGMNTNANSAYNNSITFSNNNVVIRGRGTTNNNTYYLRFNSSSGNDNYRFRYYARTSQQDIQLYKKVTPTAPAYVALQDGQWHEFYLDNPVTFNVGSDNAGLSLGYTYVQYPTGTTGQNLFPIGINPQSTTHDHYANLTMTTSGNGDIVITVPSYNTMFQTITVTDNNTGNTLTSWSSAETTVTDGTYTYYQMPSGWTLSGVYMFTYTTSGYTFGYLSSDSESSITISSSLLNGSDNVSVTITGAALDEGQYVDVNGDSRSLTSGYTFSQSWNPVDLSGGSSTTTGFVQFDFSQYGDLAVQLIFKSKKPTPNAPTVTPTTGDANVTISITPDPATDGNLVYYVDNNGQQTQDLTFPRGETDYVVTVHAYTTATENYNQSPEAVVPVTIPALPQTPAPTIAISSQTDDEVTITATGNGTVILNIPGYEPATGNGSASITVPRHMSDYVVTATATAQASGELVSTTTTQNITVPGMSNDGWTQMTGTYDNPNDLLSFLTLDANADTTMVMLLDQFLESTVFNDHPSSYTYVLKETKVINGVDSTMTSNPATIPVYKTNSTMRGLYTEAQVLADDYADEANRLTANAVNSEMDYDVVPDNNVLYYSLYRGGKDEPTPVVDVDHRISQLQKFEDKVGDNVTYYFTENHPTGILPRYDHEDNIGSQIVERLDVDYVTGETGDQMSYVPVIWTFGLYTARGDGKNNSYGSDIKVNELGGVDVSSDIIVNWSDNNKMKVNGVDYYVVSPVITLDAVAPELVKANDNESYKYEPYMYRVWCTYTDAHNFGHVVNPDGINYSLIETGLIEAPFLIGEVQADTLSDPSHVVIGRDLGHVSPQTQWSFAVTKEAVTNGDIKFVARYYYKKVVTEPASPDQPSGMRGNRDGGADYAIYEKSTSSSNIVTGVNELWSDYGKVVISQTYVNAQGMQSDKPFDGLNIVVTRFSDGTTTTTKVVR